MKRNSVCAANIPSIAPEPYAVVLGAAGEACIDEGPHGLGPYGLMGESGDGSSVAGRKSLRGFDFLEQLLAAQELGIAAFALHEIVVLSLLHNCALVQYENPIGIAHGAHAV